LYGKLGSPLKSKTQLKEGRNNHQEDSADHTKVKNPKVKFPGKSLQGAYKASLLSIGALKLLPTCNIKHTIIGYIQK